MPSADISNIEYKAMQSEATLDKAEGIVECFVAGIGNKDSVGDVCAPGAFNKSLTRRKPRVVWGHNWNDPIGKVLEIYEVPPNDPRLPAKMRAAGIGGLYARVQFNLMSEKGREAFANVAFFGEEQEWSIGYKTINAKFDPQMQANILYEVELYEVSPVLHGANQLTGTISVKSDDKQEVSVKDATEDSFLDVNEMKSVAEMQQLLATLKEVKGHGMMPVAGMPTGMFAPKPAPMQQGPAPRDVVKPVRPSMPENPMLIAVRRELAARTGTNVIIRSLEDNVVVFDAVNAEGESSTYRIAYHYSGGDFMFGKPERVNTQTVYVPESKPTMGHAYMGDDASEPMVVIPGKSAFSNDLVDPSAIDETSISEITIEIDSAFKSGNSEKVQALIDKIEGILSTKSQYVIPVDIEDAFEFKQLIDPILDYYQVDAEVSEEGIVIKSGMTPDFVDAIDIATKASLGQMARNIGGGVSRGRRAVARFDPKAWDGDNDGIVQEGTPFQRPAIPGINDFNSRGRVNTQAATRAWEQSQSSGRAKPQAAPKKQGISSGAKLFDVPDINDSKISSTEKYNSADEQLTQLRDVLKGAKDPDQVKRLKRAIGQLESYIKDVENLRDRETRRRDIARKPKKAQAGRLSSGSRIAPKFPDLDGLDQDEADEALEDFRDELFDFTYRTEDIARGILGNNEYNRRFDGAVPLIEEMQKNHDGSIEQRELALLNALARAEAFSARVDALSGGRRLSSSQSTRNRYDEIDPDNLLTVDDAMRRTDEIGSNAKYISDILMSNPVTKGSGRELRRQTDPLSFTYGGKQRTVYPESWKVKPGGGISFIGWDDEADGYRSFRIEKIDGLVDGATPPVGRLSSGRGQEDNIARIRKMALADENLRDLYKDDARYEDDLLDWIDANPGKTEKDWQKTNEYADRLLDFENSLGDQADREADRAAGMGRRPGSRGRLSSGFASESDLGIGEERTWLIGSSFDPADDQEVTLSSVEDSYINGNELVGRTVQMGDGRRGIIISGTDATVKESKPRELGEDPYYAVPGTVKIRITTDKDGNPLDEPYTQEGSLSAVADNGIVGGEYAENAADLPDSFLVEEDGGGRLSSGQSTRNKYDEIDPDNLLTVDDAMRRTDEIGSNARYISDILTTNSVTKGSGRELRRQTDPLSFMYGGKQRTVYPESWKVKPGGGISFIGWDEGADGYRSFRVEKIDGLIDGATPPVGRLSGRTRERGLSSGAYKKLNEDINNPGKPLSGKELGMGEVLYYDAPRTQYDADTQNYEEIAVSNDFISSSNPDKFVGNVVRFSDGRSGVLTRSLSKPRAEVNYQWQDEEDGEREKLVPGVGEILITHDKDGNPLDPSEFELVMGDFGGEGDEHELVIEENLDSNYPYNWTIYGKKVSNDVLDELLSVTEKDTFEQDFMQAQRKKIRTRRLSSGADNWAVWRKDAKLRNIDEFKNSNGEYGELPESRKRIADSIINHIESMDTDSDDPGRWFDDVANGYIDDEDASAGWQQLSLNEKFDEIGRLIEEDEGLKSVITNYLPPTTFSATRKEPTTDELIGRLVNQSIRDDVKNTSRLRTAASMGRRLSSGEADNTEELREQFDNLDENKRNEYLGAEFLSRQQDKEFWARYGDRAYEGDDLESIDEVVEGAFERFTQDRLSSGRGDAFEEVADAENDARIFNERMSNSENETPEQTATRLGLSPEEVQAAEQRHMARTRDKMVFDDRMSGLTLDQSAAKFGTTREGIRAAEQRHMARMRSEEFVRSMQEEDAKIQEAFEKEMASLGQYPPGNPAYYGDPTDPENIRKATDAARKAGLSVEESSFQPDMAKPKPSRGKGRTRVGKQDRTRLSSGQGNGRGYIGKLIRNRAGDASMIRVHREDIGSTVNRRVKNLSRGGGVFGDGVRLDFSKTPITREAYSAADGIWYLDATKLREIFRNEDGDELSRTQMKNLLGLSNSEAGMVYNGGYISESTVVGLLNEAGIMDIDADAVIANAWGFDSAPFWANASDAAEIAMTPDSVDVSDMMISREQYDELRRNGERPTGILWRTPTPSIEGYPVSTSDNQTESGMGARSAPASSLLATDANDLLAALGEDVESMSSRQKYAKMSELLSGLLGYEFTPEAAKGAFRTALNYPTLDRLLGSERGEEISEKLGSVGESAMRTLYRPVVALRIFDAIERSGMSVNNRQINTAWRETVGGSVGMRLEGIASRYVPDMMQRGATADDVVDAKRLKQFVDALNSRFARQDSEKISFDDVFPRNEKGHFIDRRKTSLSSGAAPSGMRPMNENEKLKDGATLQSTINPGISFVVDRSYDLNGNRVYDGRFVTNRNSSSPGETVGVMRRFAPADGGADWLVDESNNAISGNSNEFAERRLSSGKGYRDASGKLDGKKIVKDIDGAIPSSPNKVINFDVDNLEDVARDEFTNLDRAITARQKLANEWRMSSPDRYDGGAERFQNLTMDLMEMGLEYDDAVAIGYNLDELNNYIDSASSQFNEQLEKFEAKVRDLESLISEMDKIEAEISRMEKDFGGEEFSGPVLEKLRSRMNDVSDRLSSGRDELRDSPEYAVAGYADEVNRLIEENPGFSGPQPPRRLSSGAMSPFARMSQVDARINRVGGDTPKSFIPPSKYDLGVPDGTRLSSGKADEFFDNLTSKLIEMIEKAQTEGGEWNPPWHRVNTLPKNAVSGHIFTGANPVWLWIAGMEKGYPTNKWATYNQWNSVGGQVKKGEKGTSLLMPIFKKVMKEDGVEVSRLVGWKAYTVFNLEQVDGINREDFVDAPKEMLDEATRINAVEKAFSSVGAVVKEGDGSSAHYSPSKDEIVMPPFGFFKSADGYYSTLGHEMVHWTGHSSRLGRPNMNSFGSEGYAAEELVAELGAAFLMGQFGVSIEPRNDHAQYLAHWLKVLRDNPNALQEASRQAQAAVKFITEKIGKTVDMQLAEEDIEQKSLSIDDYALVPEFIRTKSEKRIITTVERLKRYLRQK
jgi:HK97 family phage prohead protease